MEAGHHGGTCDIQYLGTSFEFETSEVVSVEILRVEPCPSTTIEDDNTGSNRVEVVTHRDRPS